MVAATEFFSTAPADTGGGFFLFSVDGLHNLVMKQRPESFNPLVGARRMHPVAEQDNRQTPVGIHPERSPGIPEMTGAVW